MYIDSLADIVNKCNNACHSTIKMKPVDVRPRTYIGFNEENYKEDPKFKVGNRLRISKYKKSFFKRLHSKLVWRSVCDLKSQKYS